MYPTLWDSACSHSGSTVSPDNQCKSPYGIYTAGKNSLKSSSVRSIAGFASSIGTKESGPTGAKVAAKDNQFIGAMNAFWKSKGLNVPISGVSIAGGTANTITFNAHGLSDGTKVIYNGGVTAADIAAGATIIGGLTDKTTYFVRDRTANTFKLAATSSGVAITLTDKGNDAQSFTPKNMFDFGVVGRDFRKEVIQKGMIYLNIFPYVIWEMQDAVNDCKSGTLTSNDAPVGGASVHAWDEAVAFYTGSLEGTAKGE